MSSSKNPPPAASGPDLEILGDQVTLHPGGYVEPSDVPFSRGPERNLVEHMARFRDSPFDFLREVGLHVSGRGWRSFDDYIGQPIFYEGFSEKMKTDVMATHMLHEKIEELAERRTQVEEQTGLINSFEAKYTRARRKEEIEGNLNEYVSQMINDMICKFESKPFIRAGYWLCTQLLTRAYHQGIHVSSEEVLRLRSVAEKAATQHQSIVFLPSHRSHIDYVSLQLVCYRLGIALPTVVAGDNLNLPVLGKFLQHAGAMWIRRSFAGDQLYTTVVQSYIETLLKGGYNFECFVEGGRSRTGKLLSPKFGILGFLLDAVISGRVDDIIICPVSTQYDKVIETESYISELLGQPKRKENIVDFLSASSLLSLRLGRVDIRFANPWSLKDFIADHQPRVALVSEARIRLLRTIGYKVLSDINAVSVVMPTALISTVLLTLRGRGCGKSELIRRVEWLSARVSAKGGRVAHFYGASTTVVVDRGLEVLGPSLVGVVDGLLEKTYYAVDRFQLSLMRNMTIHLFISEALVSAAMYTRVKQGGGIENQRISYQELYDYVSFLSSLFSGEFIYPTKGLPVNLRKTLQGLEFDQVITVLHDTKTNDPISVELSDFERKRGREDYDFYCFLVWPFVEASWLGAVSLMCLTPPFDLESASVPDGSSKLSRVSLPFPTIQSTAQLFGKTLYHQGDLSYFEAVNKEVLRNAYQKFESDGIILIAKLPPSSTSKSGETRVRLSPEWMPERDQPGTLLPRGKLWDFIEKIGRARREGKNRRDSVAISRRVLALADQIGRELWRGKGVDELIVRDGKNDGDGSLGAESQTLSMKERARL